jgi:Flp pilus assembly protein protease CpaA
MAAVTLLAASMSIALRICIATSISGATHTILPLTPRQGLERARERWADKGRSVGGEPLRCLVSESDPESIMDSS